MGSSRRPPFEKNSDEYKMYLQYRSFLTHHVRPETLWEWWSNARLGPMLSKEQFLVKLLPPSVRKRHYPELDSVKERSRHRMNHRLEAFVVQTAQSIMLEGANYAEHLLTKYRQAYDLYEDPIWLAGVEERLGNPSNLWMPVDFKNGGFDRRSKDYLKREILESVGNKHSEYDRIEKMLSGMTLHDLHCLYWHSLTIDDALELYDEGRI